MKGIFCLILLFGSTTILYGQKRDTLHLTACHQDARKAYPLSKQKDLLGKITEEKIRSLQTNYLPQFSLNAQMTYQSDVTEIPVKSPLFSIPEMDKDIYKFSLDVQQVIYNGGVTRKQKEIERTTMEVEQTQLEADLYTLKDRINQIYFSILQIQENRKILELILDDLQQQMGRLESGVKNGMILESQLDVLRARMLEIEQQLTELDAGKQAGLAMLGEFLNRPLAADVILSVPEGSEKSLLPASRRMEPMVMTLQEKRLETTKSLVSGKYLPKVYAFGQAGYGRPGLNMLRNEFDSYWLLGARFSWNLWNWNNLKKERNTLDYQIKMIENQSQTFDKNLKIGLEKQAVEIAKFRKLLEQDQEIVRIREKVTKTARSQLENGTITSSDYITELNQEAQARINKENHRIRLIKAQIDLWTLEGRY